MNYNRITITSAGGTITAKTLINGYEDIEIYSAAPVTLSAAVSITVSDLYPYAQFNIRWNANVALNTYLLTICGISITQDAINQTGTFVCVYNGSTWSVQYFADGKDQPQAAQGVTDIPVPVGGTKTLTAGVDAAYQRLVGSPTTLTSNYTVTAGTTGIKAGSQFQIEIAGGITLGSNTLTVFGVSINANQALNGGVIIFATFDGISTWVAASTSKPISTADIDPITDLSVMGNPTNVTATPTEITFQTDFGVLQRNGTTLTTGLLTADNFAVGTPVMQLAVTSLSSAQILASFTTPIKILDTLANYAIIHNIVILMSPGTAYATNVDARIYFQLATDDLMVADGVWGATSSGGYQAFFLNLGTTAYQVGKASDLFIATSTGNPTAGTGTAQVLVYYTLYN